MVLYKPSDIILLAFQYPLLAPLTEAKVTIVSIPFHPSGTATVKKSDVAYSEVLYATHRLTVLEFPFKF